MQTLEVDLGARSYPIHVGHGLIHQPDLLAPHVQGNQVVIVSSETIAPLYVAALRSALASFDTLEILLPDGEANKTLDRKRNILAAAGMLQEGVSVEDFIRGVLDNAAEGVTLFGGNSMPDDMESAGGLAGAAADLFEPG